MNIECEVARVFSILFEKEINYTDTLTMDNEPLWDSMKHIEVIMTIEEELEVSFPPADIPKLKSMTDIVKKIKELKCN